MNVIFGDSEIVSRLPTGLANSIQEMERERTETGVESTPDETCNVIEEFFTHIGCLWIAEVLHHTEHGRIQTTDQRSQVLLREIYEAISEQRKRTVGSWVGLSSMIRQFFLERELPTFVNGLSALGFRSANPKTHPVNRLLDFRNEFAHGSFEAPAHKIDVHYQILSDVIARVPGLWQQPMWGTTDAQWVLCGSTVSVSEESPDIIGVEGQVVIFDQAQTQQMTLSPLYVIQGLEVTRVLFKKLTVDQLFIQETIGAWQQTYARERKGYLARESDVLRQRRVGIPAALHEQIARTLPLMFGKTLLVQGHPGCGVRTVLRAFSEDGHALRSGFDGVFVWDIHSADLTQSAVTFAHKIFRTVEQMLDLQEQRWGSKKDSLFRQMEVCLSALEDRKLLVVVDGLEDGLSAYRGEPHTMLEVCNALTEMACTVVIAMDIGSVRQTLFYDDLVQCEATTIIDPSAFQKAKKKYAPTEFYQNILKVLSVDAGKHLFDICDALDEGNELAFEPKVEYALWSLRPLLTTEHQELTIDGESTKGRVWSLFSSEVNSEQS